MRKNFLLLFLMALLPLAGWAASTTYNGANTVLRFKAIVNNDDASNIVYTAEILGFVNEGDVDELTIPATVNFAEVDGGAAHTYKVVKVLANAFKDNETLTKVTFSGNLTEIEDAFNGCTNLTTVDFTAATDLTTIAENAFKGTKITALDLSTTKVETINNLFATDFEGTPAVANNTLQSVSLPKTVTSIVTKAFDNCTALRTVEFATTGNAANQTIAASAFRATVIESLDLSKTTVAAINNLFGTTATVKNAKLEEVKLPKTVTSIVEKAFENCTALTTVTFETADAAVTINAAAFAGTAIETLDLENTKIASIENMFGTTYDSPAIANTTLKTVKLPTTWTTINTKAFANCTGLQTISLYPGTGTSAGSQSIKTLAFQGTALTALDFTSTTVSSIPEKLLIDGTNVESNNTLVTVTLTDKFTASESGLNNSFAACLALTTVDGLQSTSIVKLNEKEFEGDANLATINTSKITTFGASAFKGCAKLTTIDLSKATSLGENAFEASGLTTVTIPKTISAIPGKCFYLCADLATVTFGHETTDEFNSIGGYAFGYTKIASITIPVKIPNNEGAIAERAFGGCESLKTFVMKPTAATIDKEIVHSKAFLGCTDVVFYTTSDYVTANPTAPAYSTYSVEAPEPETTAFETVKFKNENKYYVKWVSTDKNIKIKKSDAKVYDAYLDDVNKTLDMVQFKTSGGYAYIMKGQVALIITDKADLSYELQEGSAKHTSWVTYDPEGTNDQVLKMTTAATDRLDLESDAIDEVGAGASIYGWVNSATNGTGFQKITSGATLPANSLYILAKAPADGSRLNVVWHDEDGNIEYVTAIEDVMAAPAAKEDGVMYNLQGVRIDNPTKKGIYIQNGKKYVVK